MKFLGSIKYTEALPQPSRRAFNRGISEQTIAALKVRISPVGGHVKKRSSSNIEITMIISQLFGFMYYGKMTIFLDIVPIWHIFMAN